MNMRSEKKRRCPACQGAELASATYVREFQPHGKTVSVVLLTSRCPACGAEFTSAAQHAENLARLKARKEQYEGLLLGEDILALRRHYGITQQQAARLFGKGKIAFSRYENETTYPDAAATLLLKLAIDKLEVVRSLAEYAGVDLPLWDARCDDERKVKLHVIFEGAPDRMARRWAGRELAGSGSRAVGDGRLRIFAYRGSSEESVCCSANDERYSSKAAFG